MDNREKLLGIIERNGITQKDCAEFIAKKTMRPCSLRSVQAWLAESSKPSARPCPDWAVVALESYFDNEEKQGRPHG